MKQPKVRVQYQSMYPALLSITVANFSVVFPKCPANQHFCLRPCKKKFYSPDSRPHTNPANAAKPPYQIPPKLPNVACLSLRRWNLSSPSPSTISPPSTASKSRKGSDNSKGSWRKSASRRPNLQQTPILHHPHPQPRQRDGDP